MKKCNTCQQEKELDRFQFRKKLSPKGVQWLYYEGRCKDCANAARRTGWAEKQKSVRTTKFENGVMQVKGWGWNPNKERALTLREANNAWRD